MPSAPHLTLDRDARSRHTVTTESENGATDAEATELSLRTAPKIDRPSMALGVWFCEGNPFLTLHACLDRPLLRLLVLEPPLDVPLLARAVNYYAYISFNGTVAPANAPSPFPVLHLNATLSPEYASVEDCNYDVALLR